MGVIQDIIVIASASEAIQFYNALDCRASLAMTI